MAAANKRNGFSVHKIVENKIRVRVRRNSHGDYVDILGPGVPAHEQVLCKDFVPWWDAASETHKLKRRLALHWNLLGDLYSAQCTLEFNVKGAFVRVVYLDQPKLRKYA